MKKLPHVLVLDNSPRHLGRRWFPKWLHARLGCPVTTVHGVSNNSLKALDGFDALVIGGSPASATEDKDWILRELDLVAQADGRQMPVMGVCFGGQLLARAFYGKDSIRRSPRPEFGWHCVQRDASDLLFDNAPTQFMTFQYHMEEVTSQPGMAVLASNANSRVQAYRVGSKPIWGVQFHLEVTPRAGQDMLRRTQHVYQKFDLTYPDLAAQAQPNKAAEQMFRNFIRA